MTICTTTLKMFTRKQTDPVHHRYLSRSVFQEGKH